MESAPGVCPGARPVALSLHPDDHLAEVRIGFDERLRLRQLVEAVDPVDERLQPPGSEVRQEVRDEAKQNETNPEVRARIRRIQRDMVRRRMLQAVPTATVIVTNPTHFAVALQYKREKNAAPIVVAKGQDLMAAKIREIARDHTVPIIENPPLARALFKECEVGDVIPGPLFGAVAEILAYLIRIKQLVL